IATTFINFFFSRSITATWHFGIHITKYMYRWDMYENVFGIYKSSGIGASFREDRTGGKKVTRPNKIKKMIACCNWGVISNGRYMIHASHMRKLHIFFIVLAPDNLE
ncbi:hypothetical protein ACJX0J_021284, partial [Zea mays]